MPLHESECFQGRPEGRPGVIPGSQFLQLEHWPLPAWAWDHPGQPKSEAMFGR